MSSASSRSKEQRRLARKSQGRARKRGAPSVGASQEKKHEPSRKRPRTSDNDDGNELIFFVVDNIHYPCTRRQRRGLKPIIIDGSNIAMAHGRDRWFSVRGLTMCIDFFVRRGHRVHAFLPSHKLRCDGSDDPRALHELVCRGLVICTPSWEACGRRYCAHDDRIILQVAAAMGGVVVSRDHFRDLQGEDARFARFLQRSLLIPTFVDDMLVFPQDPLGEHGPTLNSFLQYL